MVARMWNYRVLVASVDGEELFAVHEVYYDESGAIVAWTENPVPLVSDDPVGMARTVEHFQRAVHLPFLRVAPDGSETLTIWEPDPPRA